MKRYENPIMNVSLFDVEDKRTFTPCHAIFLYAFILVFV